MDMIKLRERVTMQNNMPNIKWCKWNNIRFNRKKKLIK